MDPLNTGRIEPMTDLRDTQRELKKSKRKAKPPSQPKAGPSPLDSEEGGEDTKHSLDTLV